MKQGIFALLLGSVVALTAPPVHATAPHTTVDYQVMVATGLAARHPFEVRLLGAEIHPGEVHSGCGQEESTRRGDSSRRRDRN